MAGKQQVHQLTVLNLHKYHLHDNRLKMPGKQTCVWRTQHRQMIHIGTGRHWQAQAGTSRHKQACCQMMLCIQVWYWTALSPSQNTAKESGRHHMHHRLMKQTQSKLQIVFNKHCLHMTSTREADRHHLFDAVLEKKFKVAGHLGTAGSACPHVLPSMKTWRHQPNTLLPVCHCQLH